MVVKLAMVLILGFAVMGAGLLGGCQPAQTGSSGAPTLSAQKETAQKPEVAAKPAEEKPLAPPVQVRMAGVGAISDAGMLIAIEKGYFQKEGIEAEYSVITDGNQILTALATGNLEVGGGSPAASMYNAAGRGIEVKIVADKGSNASARAFAALAVRKDLVDSGEVSDYGDLKGRTIAMTNLSAGSTVQLAKALEKGGLTLEDVNITIVSFPDMMAAFGNRSIEASMWVEPLLTVGAERGVATKWRTVDQFYPNDQAGVVLYSPKFAQDQPEAARRWMVAYLKAVRDYNDAFSKGQGRDEIVDILVRRTSVKDAAMYAKMGMPALNPDGYADARDLAYKQDFFARRGDVKDKADMAKMVDNQYVDSALKKLGRYPR